MIDLFPISNCSRKRNRKWKGLTRGKTDSNRGTRGAWHFGECLQFRGKCTCAPSCLTLRFPMDCSPSGSSAQGISQARILGWVAISYARAGPGLKPASPALAGGFFTLSHVWSPSLEVVRCFKVKRQELWLVCRTENPPSVPLPWSPCGQGKHTDIFIKVKDLLTEWFRENSFCLSNRHCSQGPLTECIQCPIMRLTTVVFRLHAGCTCACSVLHENSMISHPRGVTSTAVCMFNKHLLNE